MPNPTTILFVDNSFTFGGAINALADLVAALDQRRFRPVVLSGQSLDFLTDRFAGTRVHEWRVRLPWVHDRVHRRVTALPGFGSGPLRWLWDKTRATAWLLMHELPDTLRIVRLARKEGVQMIHLNNGVEGLGSALFAGKLLRLPVIAHARGPQGTKGLVRIYAGMVDRWIAVSGWIASNLREAGVDDGRIEIVHDAVELKSFHGQGPAADRAELGIPSDVPVFGVFGRIIPWKGIREFAEAAAEVVTELPDAVALIVGDRSDGSEDYYRDVVELVNQRGVSDRVLFTGFRSDVPALMRLCDVIVHTSTSPEPFGLTVVEGMATARPVVAADKGGPLETVVAGRTGLLVNPSDTRELAEAIVGLLRDPETAAQMGAAGAARVRRHFSPERHAARVQAVYSTVLARV